MAGGVVEGLYREDERDGPGVFSDSGRDDVGFWWRERLVKLCVSVPGVLDVRDHWPLSINVDEQRARVTLDPPPPHRRAPPPPPADDCPPPPSDGHLLDARLPADSLAVDRRAFDDAFAAAAAVEERSSSSWRRQLRDICVGSYTL